MRAGKQRRTGAAAVEAGLILIFILVPLLLGMFELGRVIQCHQVISNAAREGARQAATAQYTKEQIRQSVLDYLKNSNVQMHDSIANPSVTLSNTNATINVDNLTTGGEVKDANQLDRVRVFVSVPTSNYRWMISSFFLPLGSNMSAESYFLCTRDVPIAVSFDIPQSPLPQ
jgi:Flp pilus assembly protein TadG